jgi:hypothetical protein
MTAQTVPTGDGIYGDAATCGADAASGGTQQKLRTAIAAARQKRKDRHSQDENKC